MFRSTWSWLVPLLIAAAVFSMVLLTTPPGFVAIPQVLFAPSRGPTTDAAAYALGAASALSLVTLVLLAVLCGALDLLLNRHA